MTDYHVYGPPAGLSLCNFGDRACAISAIGGTICSVKDIKLIGPHNQANVCAAVAAAWQVVPDPEALRQAVVGFTGLPHRLEFVDDVAGVRYYDDSYATTPEATNAALRALSQSKVLILGGSDKGADFRELAMAIAASRVRGCVLIGDTIGELHDLLVQAGFGGELEAAVSIEEAVRTARGLAQPGDVVVLSPGCASFGWFRSAKERGEQFQRAVRSLGQGERRVEAEDQPPRKT